MIATSNNSANLVPLTQAELLSYIALLDKLVGGTATTAEKVEMQQMATGWMPVLSTYTRCFGQVNISATTHANLCAKGVYAGINYVDVVMDSTRDGCVFFQPGWRNTSVDRNSVMVMVDYIHGNALNENTASALTGVLTQAWNWVT